MMLTHFSPSSSQFRPGLSFVRAPSHFMLPLSEIITKFSSFSQNLIIPTGYKLNRQRSVVQKLSWPNLSSRQQSRAEGLAEQNKISSSSYRMFFFWRYNFSLQIILPNLVSGLNPLFDPQKPIHVNAQPPTFDWLSGAHNQPPLQSIIINSSTFTSSHQKPLFWNGLEGGGGNKPNLKQLQNQLSTLGLSLRDVSSDGNCLFRAVADLIEDREDNHKFYRDLAISFIRNNKHAFVKFLPENEKIDSHIQNMSKDGSWAGHIEILVLCACLNVRFRLFMLDKPPLTIGLANSQVGSNKMLHLAYLENQHYLSVRKTDDNSKFPAEPVQLDIISVECLEDFPSNLSFDNTEPFQFPKSAHPIPHRNHILVSRRRGSLTKDTLKTLKCSKKRNPVVLKILSTNLWVPPKMKVIWNPAKV